MNRHKRIEQLMREQIEGRIRLAEKMAKGGPQARVRAQAISDAARRDAESAGLSFPALSAHYQRRTNMNSEQSNGVACPWCGDRVAVLDARLAEHVPSYVASVDDRPCPCVGLTLRQAQDETDKSIMHHAATGE